jgi:predicted DNA-binding protein with PD1-like motif
MKYSQAQRGRTFIIRLEDGEILHESIERFAEEQGITAAACIVLGGADKGSALVTGPAKGRADPIVPVVGELEEAHEITGTGTIFPDRHGKAKLHMHIACGRYKDVSVGCVREGVKVWHVMEIILFELTENKAQRLLDEQTGFELLVPELQ